MSNKLKVIFSAIGLVLLALVAYGLLHTQVHPSVGTTNQPANCGGTVTCFTDLGASNVYMYAEEWLGGSTDTTAREEIVTTGSCNTASSTLFATQSPFTTASSTVNIEVFGAGQATSTTLSVSTSTTGTGLISTTLGVAGLINSGVVPTSTPNFTFRSGVTVGSVGTNSAGSGTQGNLEVSPQDFIAGYATSTYTGAGAANYSAGLSCTWKATWSR